MNLHQWAIKWGVSQAALEDLRRQMGLDDAPVPAVQGKGEAWAP